MREQLTKTQCDIYAFVAGYIYDNKFSPTYQEIADRTHISVQAVDSHVRNIARKGWIKFNGKKHRKITLI